MRKLLFCLMAMVIVAVAAYPQSVQVTSPNGTENWMAGVSKNVTWKYESLPAGTLVKLVLFKGGVDPAHKVGNIVQNIPAGTNGSGSCPWTVGNCEGGGTAIPGPGFYIRLITMDGACRDESDAPFTISSFTSLPLDKPVDIGRLRLHLPDLVVCMSWDGKRPYLGGKKLVKVRIKNIGLGASLATDLNFYVEDIGTNLIQVPALTANGEFNYEHKFWWNTLGHKSVWLVVDYHMKNTEANEDNNAITGSINVISPGQDRYVAETNRCSDQN